MGIMYKLMKHKHRGNEMDLSNNSRIVEHHSSSTHDSKEHKKDKKFTAEHILQLCKFLAEKSKRNKSVCKTKQKSKETMSTRQLEYSRDASFFFEEINDMETDANTTDTDTSQDADVALALVSHNRLAASDLAFAPQESNVVLTDKVINTNPQQHQIPATCSQQFQQGNKKDILQKIRSQILERKRQRQLAGMQRIGTVWRPW